MDNNILKSIFENHKIKKVIVVEEATFLNFIICSMAESISFDRWTNLENILKYHTNKEISLTSHHQALKYFGKNYLSKGVIICE